jgi:NitT/TauT family transport system substrate-binding protein
MKNRVWSACAGAVAMLMLLPGSQASAQQKSEVTLSRQPGIFYMPSHIMEKNKLIEKHAASLGVPGVTTKWINLSGGGAQTDALLAGSVDILNTGTGCCGIAPAAASRASSPLRRSR